MRTGPIVGGVILLVIGVGILIGGAPIRGLGDTANGYCASYNCGADDRAAGAMFVSLGNAMLWGGGLVALAGIGLMVAGVMAAPKPPRTPVSVPVSTAATRPCPSCEATMPTDAKYCNHCGAAVSPVKPRLAP